MHMRSVRMNAATRSITREQQILVHNMETNANRLATVTESARMALYGDFIGSTVIDVRYHTVVDVTQEMVFFSFEPEVKQVCVKIADVFDHLEHYQQRC